MASMRTIDYYENGDFIEFYSSDALIVAGMFNLTRLALSPEHATKRWPAGTSHVGFLKHYQDAYFAKLREEDWDLKLASHRTDGESRFCVGCGNQIPAAAQFDECRNCRSKVS